LDRIKTQTRHFKASGQKIPLRIATYAKFNSFVLHGAGFKTTKYCIGKMVVSCTKHTMRWSSMTFIFLNNSRVT